MYLCVCVHVCVCECCMCVCVSVCVCVVCMCVCGYVSVCVCVSEWGVGSNMVCVMADPVVFLRSPHVAH